MTTQEAQAIINNWKGSPDDPKYLEAKALLEGQQVQGEPQPEEKTLGQKVKDKLFMSPEEMQNWTSQRADVQNAIERSKGANPATSKMDNMTGNITGLTDNPLKASDVNADGSLTESGKAKAVENRLGNVGNDTGDTGNFQLGEQADAVSEAVAPSKDDTPKEAGAKKQYNKSMMSIWDAYNNGYIDKATAGYFTIDAIATLAKNLGRSMGNVAAQFSGGSIDNGHDESKWEQRQDKMFNTELQKESESIKTFDNILKGYQVDKSKTINDMLNDFNAKANDKSLSDTERKFYQTLAVQIAGAGLDGNTQVANIGSGIWNDIKAFMAGEKKQ